MNHDDERLEALVAAALRPEPSDPPPHRVAQLRAEVTRARRQPTGSAGRWTWLRPATAGVAASIVLAVAVGFALGHAARGRLIPPPPPTETVALGHVDPSLDASATIIAHTWGTELNLAIDGLRDDEVYEVMIASADGSQVHAGTFLGVSDRTVTCEMNAAVLREDAAGFTVTDAGGATIITAELPTAAAVATQVSEQREL